MRYGEHDILIALGPLTAMLALLGLGLGASPAALAEQAWQSQPYAYRIVEQDLRDVLLEFGRNTGMPVTVSKAVKGTVRGGPRAREAGEFLAQLSLSHGLSWYEDGGTLHVYALSEHQTRWLPAAHLDAAARRRFAQDWRARGNRVAVSADAASAQLIVHGPSPFQERVAQALQALQALRAPARAAGGAHQVKVFRGSAGGQVVSLPR